MYYCQKGAKRYMKKIAFTFEQKKIRREIVDVCYKAKTSHLGSCLTSIDIIDAVYKIKDKDDHFVLSCGHSGIALYAVLAERKFIDTALLSTLHLHPDRNLSLGIEVSTGSLGQGLPIALGMALADKNKKVYCLISDGECAEGSIWETFNIIVERNVSNIIVIVNANGWGAYDPISLPRLYAKIKGFGLEVINVDGHDVTKIISAIQAATQKASTVIFAETIVEQLPFLTGLDAHYHVMDENDYRAALEVLR